MAVFRVEKNKDYTVMSNYHLRNKEMSLKAKGLLSLMLSLPDDWDYSLNGLVAICQENESSIRAILKELETLGYLERIRTQNEKGQFEYNYNIYEKPLAKKPCTEKPHTENPYTENPYTENRTQLNTNILNTNKLNTDDDVVMKFYLNNINSTPVIREIEILESYKEELPQDLILYAMEKAVENKGRSLGYIKGILNSWKSKGITTLAEAKEERKVTQNDDAWEIARKQLEQEGKLVDV